jgi:hypothetical protein
LSQLCAGLLHVLLDAYGYEGDRTAFGPEVIERARRNAEVIRQLAEGHEPVYQALLPIAANLEQAVVEIEALPDSFWARPHDGVERGGTPPL